MRLSDEKQPLDRGLLFRRGSYPYFGGDDILRSRLAIAAPAYYSRLTFPWILQSIRRTTCCFSVSSWCSVAIRRSKSKTRSQTTFEPSDFNSVASLFCLGVFSISFRYVYGFDPAGVPDAIGTATQLVAAVAALACLIVASRTPPAQFHS